jgi:hypothetical protein
MLSLNCWGQHNCVCPFNSRHALAPKQVEPDNQCSACKLWNLQSALALAACTGVSTQPMYKFMQSHHNATNDQCWLHGSCFSEVQYTQPVVVHNLLQLQVDGLYHSRRADICWLVCAATLLPKHQQSAHTAAVLTA